MTRLTFSLLFVLFFNFVFSQTMHVFLVVQNDPTVGALKDTTTMLRLLEEIDQELQELQVNIKVIDAAEATEARMQQEVNSLVVNFDDVIWFYYTGHGANYDTWPVTDQTDLPLSKVNNLLKQTGARLTLTMFDSCNWGDPVVLSEREPGWVKSYRNYYKYLFLYSKGNLKIASCASKQFSFGSAKSGSFFTNAFKDAIKENATWKNVLAQTKRQTETLAVSRSRIQSPKYQFSYDFKDGIYR